MATILIYQPLYNILAILTNCFAGQVGWALLCLAMLARLIIWPIFSQNNASQKQMADLNPKLKQLSLQYKDNPQEMNKQTMALFKEAKVNPFHSLLLLAVQLIIIFVLFFFFGQVIKIDWSVYLYPFISAPQHLSYNWLGFDLRQPSLILTIIVGVMNALTVLIQPNVGQNKITLFLFSFLILFMYKLFPGAVILLWIGFSLVGLIQELYLKSIKSSRSETPVLSNKNQEHNNTTDSGVNNLN